MVNRYGPWLDASTVLPAPGRDGAPACTVQTTWWLDARRAGGADGVAASLAASDQARPRRRAAAGDPAHSVLTLFLRSSWPPATRRGPAGAPQRATLHNGRHGAHAVPARPSPRSTRLQLLDLAVCAARIRLRRRGRARASAPWWAMLRARRAGEQAQRDGARLRVCPCLPACQTTGPNARMPCGAQVQQEDIRICESVQRGLGSPAYGSGRCGCFISLETLQMSVQRHWSQKSRRQPAPDGRAGPSDWRPPLVHIAGGLQGRARHGLACRPRPPSNTSHAAARLHAHATEALPRANRRRSAAPSVQLRRMAAALRTDTRRACRQARGACGRPCPTSQGAECPAASSCTLRRHASGVDTPMHHNLRASSALTLPYPSAEQLCAAQVRAGRGDAHAPLPPAPAPRPVPRRCALLSARHAHQPRPLCRGRPWSGMWRGAGGGSQKAVCHAQMSPHARCCNL
jgi:hypothetical protein